MCAHVSALCPSLCLCFSFASLTVLNGAGPYAHNIVENRFITRWLIGNPDDSTGGAFVSVDTFFFLSGFLAMLSQLEKYSLSSGPDLPLCRFWGKAVLFRFLRLTPMYLFVLMIYIYVFPMIGNGPEWHPGMEDLYEPKMKEFCREMWWTNILYISNLFPGQLGARNPDPGWLGHLNGPKEFTVDGRMPNGEGELGCYIQTWYLSNDMQLFLLTPVVAVFFKRSRQHAYALLVAVLVLMHAYIIYLTTSYKLSTCDQLTSNPPFGGGDHSPSNTGDFQVMLYDKPWYRPGYYIGVLLACIYVDHRDPESKSVPKLSGYLQRCIYWAVLIVLFVYSSVGSYNNTFEKLGTDLKLSGFLFNSFSFAMSGMPVLATAYNISGSRKQDRRRTVQKTTEEVALAIITWAAQPLVHGAGRGMCYTRLSFALHGASASA
eukprot:COSAG02_NODE_239_length_27693_cov_31.385700_13_plen_432_part_00